MTNEPPTVLIADSGATKTEWRILRNGKIRQARTGGINPFYLDTQQIAQLLQKELIPHLRDGHVQAVHFYGAGCIGNHSLIPAEALSCTFPNAVVEVHSDLLAAARSLCGTSPGIVCILGTGSASCCYDGIEIVRQVPSLGYILGDEGSGADVGRRVVAAYLRGELPEALHAAFQQSFTIDKAQVLKALNEGQMPSRYLAQFARFATDQQRHPLIHQMLYDSFLAFARHYILSYPQAEQQKVHFSGSVAFYNNTVLRSVARDAGFSIGNVVESPIAGLTLFHTNQS
jgi:N-acetylglucosamine kinase-like BadF-type ATPase